MTDVFLLPVHEIRLKPNLPCGLNVLTLLAITAAVRNSHIPVDPVLVAWRPEIGGWLLLDGRHRWTAHLIAGREQIRCVEEVVTDGQAATLP
jgi:hypothetical protein